MKSLTWSALCGAIYATSIHLFRSGNIIEGAFVILLFLIITTLSLAYVALHVIIPLQRSMLPEDPYWTEKMENLTGIKKWSEKAKIYITRVNLFYVLICVGYFFYGREIAIYLASKI